MEEPPAGWVVWTEEPEGRVVLAYRPDVFDTETFPAPCLPTLYVSNGSRRRRPGAGQVETATWHATLLLEPEVEVDSEVRESRDGALEAARGLAAAFAAGDLDYRDAYQIPRDAYLSKLDELTG